MKKALLILGISVAVLLPACLAEAEVLYTVTNITSAAPSGEIVPDVGWDLNNSGEITGHGYVSELEETAKPYRWSPVEGYLNLGDMEGNLTGGFGGNGYAVNDKGWVCGRNSAYHPTDLYNYRAFLWVDDNGNGAVDPCEMRDLGMEPTDTYASAWQMNNHGDVCCSGNNSGGWVWKDIDGDLRYDAGERILTQYGGVIYYPQDINDAGQVIMTGQDTGNRWTDLNNNRQIDAGEITVIPNLNYYHELLPDRPVYVSRINESGQVAGSFKVFDTSRQGFFWSDDNGDNVVDEAEVTVFGSYDKTTHCRGLNDDGVIVGGTYEWRPTYDDRQAFIWTAATGMQNLNDMIDYTIEGMPAGTFWLSQAEGINNKGQIVATAKYELTEGGLYEYTLLLTPIVVGDFDSDADVDLADFAVLVSQWGAAGCAADDWCSGTDMNEDGDVDGVDLASFCEQWLTGVY